MAIGTVAENGIGLTLDERLRMAADLGFDAIMLEWNKNAEPGLTWKQRAQAVRDHGMTIENGHATILPDLNDIWLEGDAGERPVEILTEEIEAASDCGVETLVMHVSNTNDPPPISNIGMDRYARLVDRAGKCGVRIAFENVRPTPHVHHVLATFTQPWIGFCYDSGHENIWTPDADWLSVYGDRLFALHMQDNHGEGDAHIPPFEGTVNWERVAKGIARSKYRGSISSEALFYQGSDYHKRGLTVETLMRNSVDAMRRLEKMIDCNRKNI